MGQDFLSNQESLRPGETKAPRKEQSQGANATQAFPPVPHCVPKKWAARSCDSVSELHQNTRPGEHASGGPVRLSRNSCRSLSTDPWALLEGLCVCPLTKSSQCQYCLRDTAMTPFSGPGAQHCQWQSLRIEPQKPAPELTLLTRPRGVGIAPLRPAAGPGGRPQPCPTPNCEPLSQRLLVPFSSFHSPLRNRS